MLHRSILGFAVLLLASLSSAAEEIRSAEGFFDQSFGDLQEEAAQAVDEGKKGVLLMFETDDCPWCKRMKETVLNRARVQDLYRGNFRILALNTEGDTPIVDFDGSEILEKDFALKHNRVRATPVFVFFDTEGQLMTRYTGAVKSVEEFMLLAEFVIGDHYKSGRFTQFKRARSSS